MHGGWRMDACDFFELTPRMIDALKAKGGINQNRDCYFYEVYDMIESDQTMDVSKLPKRHVTFMSIDVSYHTTDSIDTFIERYIKDEDNEN